jgi:hypothetical protein
MEGDFMKELRTCTRRVRETVTKNFHADANVKSILICG